MKIYILRHGEAGVSSISDAARELTGRGRAQTADLVQRLKKENVSFDTVLASPYTRTRQTAAVVMENIDFQPRLEICELITPDDSPRVVVDMLAHRKEQSILIVSHQPLVSRLIEFLVLGTDSGNASFPPMLTSSMACLSADVVARGCAELHWLKSQPTFDNMSLS
jgi:phosphohistidine phosphatase